MVRQPGDDGVVGRLVAERGIRNLHRIGGAGPVAVEAGLGHAVVGVQHEEEFRIRIRQVV